MKDNYKQPFEFIIFDLDETLYPKEAGVMKVIKQRVVSYMVHKLGLPADDVPSIQHDLYQRYGTSLRGLMLEHRVDPLDYLKFVYDINLRDFLGISPPLARMLEDIPLRKVVFTNAEARYARRVLETLQVASYFERVIDICELNYVCKPDPKSYRQVLDILEVSGRQCIMVDDSPRNLIPAKDVGMTTILVDSDHTSSAVDYAVPTVFHVERVLKNLLPYSNSSHTP